MGVFGKERSHDRSKSQEIKAKIAWINSIEHKTLIAVGKRKFYVTESQKVNKTPYADRASYYIQV